MVGLAMTLEDMSCLHDAYEALDPDALIKSTTYILQFLWRDRTSSFDIVGPHHRTYLFFFYHSMESPKGRCVRFQVFYQGLSFSLSQAFYFTTSSLRQRC